MGLGEFNGTLWNGMRCGLIYGMGVGVLVEWDGTRAHTLGEFNGTLNGIG